MRRLRLTPRADWRAQAEAAGFHFHTPDGQIYWDESVAYAFSLRQVEEDVEAAAQSLAGLCYEAAGQIVQSDELMARCRIPERFRDYVAQSWRNAEKDLYGRFDLRYDGAAPPKLYEFNADTPTSLFEAAVFQWLWLEGRITDGALPAQADQFNSIQERLIDAFGLLEIDATLFFASVKGSAEDRGTVEYLADCAQQAGLLTAHIAIEDIGVQGRHFVDLDDKPIRTLFKLYPWEWLFADEFGQQIPGASVRLIEPAWKSVLSNKALMPILWQLFEGHPNLLPAYFEDDPRAVDLGAEYARKPILGREGANVRLVTRDGEQVAPGPYGAEGAIIQQLALPPAFDGNYPVIGAWIVAGEPCGMGIREQDRPITTEAARFVPHFIAPE